MTAGATTRVSALHAGVRTPRPDQKLSLSANWIWRMALEVEVM
jgi:hypothetical protein